MVRYEYTPTQHTRCSMHNTNTCIIYLVGHSVDFDSVSRGSMDSSEVIIDQDNTSSNRSAKDDGHSTG